MRPGVRAERCRVAGRACPSTRRSDVAAERRASRRRRASTGRRRVLRGWSPKGTNSAGRSGSDSSWCRRARGVAAGVRTTRRPASTIGQRRVDAVGEVARDQPGTEVEVHVVVDVVQHVRDERARAVGRERDVLEEARHALALRASARASGCRSGRTGTRSCRSWSRSATAGRQAVAVERHVEHGDERRAVVRDVDALRCPRGSRSRAARRGPATPSRLASTSAIVLGAGDDSSRLLRYCSARELGVSVGRVEELDRARAEAA